MKMEAFFLCSPLLSERKELYYLLANIKFLFVFYSIAGTESVQKQLDRFSADLENCGRVCLE